jgi:transposase, IS4 family
MYRPSDKVDRELHYSGKKKRHTLKNVLLIDSFGSIHFLSDTYEGRVHDKCIADEARYTLPTGSMLYQDAGLGFNLRRQISREFNLRGVQIMQPKKKPRNGTLTPQEKEENRRISSIRVHIGTCHRRYQAVSDYSRHHPSWLFRISGYGHGNMLRAA